MAPGVIERGMDMLNEVLLATASAGGAAVVQAMADDAWESVRATVTGWFARQAQEKAALATERLDRSAVAVRTADPDQADAVIARETALWTGKLEDLLTDHPDLLPEVQQLSRQHGSTSVVNVWISDLRIGENASAAVLGHGTQNIVLRHPDADR